jgi:hypothetical protein
MRRLLLAAGVIAALAVPMIEARSEEAALAAVVAAADIDYSDFDDTLMRSMDDAIKELDSNVGGQQADDALTNTAVLRDGLAWAEKYFAAKPQAPLGVGYARDAQQRLALLVQALQSHDFDAAAGNLRAVAKACKTCHQAYKPPD